MAEKQSAVEGASGSGASEGSKEKAATRDPTNHLDEPNKLPGAEESWPGEVKLREQRKLRSRREGRKRVWFGLGMFGLIGWSVSVPTVLGVMLGIWIDQRWPSRYSWTLIFLVLGLMLGCMQAWYWISQERRLLRRDNNAQKE